ncbi:MAG: DUF5683 domain-containing protein [Cytophagales bacterium]|nr:DUF5683 domain-containing protein [Cytophagales bacterium]
MLRTGSFFLLFFLAQTLCAQRTEVTIDTTRQSGDTLIIRRGGKIITAEGYAARYVPRKALLFSAILPGMGQVYNKKYWKVPLVYGGFAMLTYVSVAYNDLYNRYKLELFEVLRDPTFVPQSGFTLDQLRSVTEFYRRQRDFFLILDGIWYLFQLVDAHVDAHLRDFDLNPQLRVSIGPSMQQHAFFGQASGLALTIKF